MSINASLPYRRVERPSLQVPPVLPQVSVSVDKAGHLDVRLDAEPYAADKTFERSDLQRIITAIATDLASPVRVEVRETDGSVFTDIVTPDDHPPVEQPAPEPPPVAEAEWLDLNAWVDWLRHTYGLPPTVVPPFWHHHDELVWELSALHQHWLNSYDPDGSPSGPLTWHRDFADARNRLREWVSTCGTKLDHDRPTRQTVWPGEPATVTTIESVVEDRDADFVRFVVDDVETRRHVELGART